MAKISAKHRRRFRVEELPESDLIIVNSEICVGCRTCELMCSLQQNHVFSLSQARLHVTRDPFTAMFVPEVCRHCKAPECYVVCPVEGAITIDSQTGARRITVTHCIGCGACAQACPWNDNQYIIRFNHHTKKYFKCDLCDGKPKCVEYCPTGALTYQVSKEGR